MNWRFLVLLVLMSLATPAALAQIQTAQPGHVRISVSDIPTQGGLRGLHIDRTALDTLPNGISFDYGEEFAWGMGLDCTMDYSYPNYPTRLPDLVLAYSAHTDADNLRLRSDDARMVLGPRIGHPMAPFQFAIQAGTPNEPLGGLWVGTFGSSDSIYMAHQDQTMNRTNLNFANLWGWGTDLAANGGTDLDLYNYQKQHATITVTSDDTVSLAGTLQHQGSQAGFFGAPPVSQPVVSGSWSDGSAAKSLLQALVKLGLVQDQTTQ